MHIVQVIFSVIFIGSDISFWKCSAYSITSPAVSGQGSISERPVLRRQVRPYRSGSTPSSIVSPAYVDNVSSVQRAQHHAGDGVSTDGAIFANNRPSTNGLPLYYSESGVQVGNRVLFEGHRTSNIPELLHRASSYRNHHYYRQKTRGSDKVVDGEGVEGSGGAVNLTIVRSTERISPNRINFGDTVEEYQNQGTTPERKTAPRTDSSVLPFVSSTAGSIESNWYEGGRSGSLDVSESNNRHFPEQNQYFPGYVTGRPVPLTSPFPHEVDVTRVNNNIPTPVYEHNNSFTRGGFVSTESIIFEPPKPTPTRRTYKLPNNQDNELDLVGVHTLLGLRGGGTGDYNPPRQPLIVPENIVGNCEKNLGYCDDLALQDGYPKDALNSILTNSISSDTFKKVFGDVVDGDVSSQVRPAEDVALSGRNGITAQETPLCNSHEVTIYPKAAQNKEDKWMFIVNHDDYVQGVKVEKCAKEGDSCLPVGSESFAHDYICRQKYILRKLVALNPDGKSLLVLDTFKLPSCCVCYMRLHNGYLADRLGTVSSVPKSSVFESGKTSEIYEEPTVDIKSSACTEQKKEGSSSSAGTSPSPVT